MNTQNSSPVQFYENACYTVEQVAAIIQYHPKTVQKLCKDGIIVARKGKGGYRIGGWQIRAYLENRLCVTN